jgi:hypothetical protein
MGTAVDFAFGLDAVTDQAAFTVGAAGGQSVNCTFEAVERHRPVALGDRNALS